MMKQDKYLKKSDGVKAFTVHIAESLVLIKLRLKKILKALQEAVYINVKDTGTGIPETIKRRIFDPFFTTKEVGKGTGLGLSLCYGIVNKHGGRLTFKSISTEDFPNRPSGSTFIVSFPAAEVSAVTGEVKGDSKNTGNR